jgi:hypothetical protein
LDNKALKRWTAKSLLGFVLGIRCDETTVVEASR